MTIKELCIKNQNCGTCSFCDACLLLDVNAPFGYVEDDDKKITKSIIETARILQEGEEIAKTFIEDVEAVKDLLPVSESEV